MTGAVKASLDSCNAAEWPGDTAGTVVGQESAWAAGRFRTFGRVSFFVPDRADVTVADTTLGYVTLAWSDCPGCRFAVGVARDSTPNGVEGQVARLLAAQRVIDSINSDPQTSVMQFDEIDGPPQPFATRGGRGYLVNDSCGDCLSTRLLFGQPGYVATVFVGGDGYGPMLPRHVCEMMVIAKTLRWRD